MSLSEYEEQRDFWEDERYDSSSSVEGRGNFPADFDEDEIAFAQDLNILFSPEDEELPPFFVQTLIEPEDQRFQPIEDGLEQRVRAHVFQRLKLYRRLFKPSESPFYARTHFSSIQRPLVAMCATFIIVIFMTILFTGPSFAAGMSILLRGASAGVFQVHSYPLKALTPVPMPPNSQDYSSTSRQLTLVMAQQMLHFPLYWPQDVPDNYVLKQLALCDIVDQQRWADGPVLQFSYEIPQRHGVLPHASGKLFISEFKPRGNVLQVVQDGAAHAVKVDQNGQAEAIYVNGQWVYRHWLYGERSELIYQKDGVIFWIAGDQRDGMDEQVLLDVAHSLHLFDVSRAVHAKGDEYMVDDVHDLAEPFRNDILAISSDDSSTMSMLTPVFPLSPVTESKTTSKTHTIKVVVKDH